MEKEVFHNYTKLLKEAVAFQSISTDKDFESDLKRCFSWYEKLFRDNGFKTKVFSTKGSHNILFAEYRVKNPKGTVLIYGHYDVQPANKEEGWKKDPFKLYFENNRFIARGVVDNKGQNLIHIASVFHLISKGKLAYNVKFFLEGDEETGSDGLEKIIKKHKNDLKSSFILISDGEVSGNTGVVESGFRGTFNAILKIKVGEVELHSGIYGGACPNAIQVLTSLLAKIYSKNNKISIKGFYDDVDKITKDILKNNKKIPFSLADFQKTTTRKQYFTINKNYDFYTQTGLLPCIEVTGIQGGYTGEGFKNAIPASSFAKLNFRLVEKQHPKKVFKLFEKFIKDNIPKYADFEIEMEGSNKPLKIDTNNKYAQKAFNLLREIWGKEPVFKYVGGSLPVTSYFYEILKKPLVMVPLANEDCNMHAVDENFKVDFMKKGINFSLKFLSI